MTWVRVEEDAPLHPKIMQAGCAGFGFFVASLCYANHFLTDGFIPASAICAVFPGLTRSAAIGLATRLVEAKLWELAEDGWRIHDFDKYQPRRGDVIEVRQIRQAGGRARASLATRINGRFTSSRPAQAPAADQQPAGDVLVDLSTSSGGLRVDSEIPRRKNEARASVPKRHNATIPPTCADRSPAQAPAEHQHVPVPVPVLEASSPCKSPTVDRHAPAGFAAFWQTYPKRVGKDAALARWRKDKLEPRADEIIAGLTRTMAYVTRDGGQFIPNPATWLHEGRWTDEPPAPSLVNGQNADAARRFLEGS